MKTKQAPRPLTVEANMGLVWSVVKRFRWALGVSLDEADLVQAGALGLMRALETFDPEQGFALATYSNWWIRHFVQREIMNSGRAIRVPVHKQESCRLAQRPLPCRTVSLDAPIGTADLSRTLLDTMGAEVDPTDAIGERRRRKTIEAALARFPERTQRIIRERFWGDCTLAEVGDGLGVSRERIRQIEVKALARLRNDKVFRKHLREERP